MYEDCKPIGYQFHGVKFSSRCEFDAIPVCSKTTGIRSWLAAFGG
jgi:hypothetical protein